MSVDTLKIYEILSSNLPDARARTVAKAIYEAIETDALHKKDIVSTMEDLANLKAELIKWMFLFWLGQIGVLSGIIFAMLKLYFK